MRINKPSINYSKSEFMIITKKQFKHKFEIVIEDNKIQQKSKNKNDCQYRKIIREIISKNHS